MWPSTFLYDHNLYVKVPKKKKKNKLKIPKSENVERSNKPRETFVFNCAPNVPNSISDSFTRYPSEKVNDERKAKNIFIINPPISGDATCIRNLHRKGNYIVLQGKGF